MFTLIQHTPFMTISKWHSVILGSFMNDLALRKKIHMRKMITIALPITIK